MLGYIEQLGTFMPVQARPLMACVPSVGRGPTLTSLAIARFQGASMLSTCCFQLRAACNTPDVLASL